MTLPTEKTPIVKDGKCFMCRLQLLTVKGGTHVLYVSDEGDVIKREPLHRYKNRINRRKGTSEKFEKD